MKNWIKRHPSTKRLALLALRLARTLQPVAISRYPAFLRQWQQFRAAGGAASPLDWYPCLHDQTSTTTVDSHYFYQSIWAFERILASNTWLHIDIGSDVRFVGMLTIITDTAFLDIRPLKVDLRHYLGIGATVLQLPFADHSIPSLSSLHVIEHIGLGRYGDPIDPHGATQALHEIQRVLSPGGRLYLSLPIGRPRVQFNGQRIFQIDQVCAALPELHLIELSIVDACGHYHETVEPDQIPMNEATSGNDCGLGLFLFTREPAIGDAR
ncbi:MAG: DUF268 domain-containing protein [Chloroflexaceae bacterium]|nr:DUF268 domain-containing protein [Chloroflexaceae bacterium]